VYNKPALSPDGGRLALGHDRNIWVYDVAEAVFSPLTFGDAFTNWPIWSPDGRYITFRSERSGTNQLYRMRADGSGEPEELTRLVTPVVVDSPNAWSPDGETLVFTVRGAAVDLWRVSLKGADDPGPTPFLQTPFVEEDATFSPDGRWLAYHSDESGRLEVYVRPFPAKGETRWRISTQGGEYPVWARNTQELFYRSGDKMMVVDYSATDEAFRPGPPRELFTLPRPARLASRSYDITPDGQRFIVLLPQESRQINVVLNWFEELERLAPMN
jgi:serine/threonine-protein kinase